jgi:hypothetical protein
VASAHRTGSEAGHAVGIGELPIEGTPVVGDLLDLRHSVPATLDRSPTGPLDQLDTAAERKDRRLEVPLAEATQRNRLAVVVEEPEHLAADTDAGDDQSDGDRRYERSDAP